MLENELLEIVLRSPDDFLKVAETLTRIGVSSRPQDDSELPALYQSCHILHKRQKYYLVHFKTMFRLDGKPSSLSESDLARRNTIANLLEEWGLVGLVERVGDNLAPISQIKIIPFRDKDKYKLVSKYSIGKRK